MQKSLLAVVFLMLAIVSIALYRIVSLDEQIRLVAVQVEQQSMLTNRALGKVIPLVLPEGVEEEIRAVESRLQDEKKGSVRVN